MDSSSEGNKLVDRLLQQDVDPNDTRYQEHRMQLELALKKAEQQEKIVSSITVISLILSLTGMFLGGTRAVGAFDPWEKDATILSVTIGVIYFVALILFWFSLASYFSRYRPRVRNVKEQIRDANIQLLHQELQDLKQQVSVLLRRESANDK